MEATCSRFAFTTTVAGVDGGCVGTAGVGFTAGATGSGFSATGIVGGVVCVIAGAAGGSLGTAFLSATGDAAATVGRYGIGGSFFRVICLATSRPPAARAATTNRTGLRERETLDSFFGGVYPTVKGTSAPTETGC